MTTEIETKFGDLPEEGSNFIKLDTTNKQFSFHLEATGGKATGYCNLTDEETEVFNNVFKRIANNVVRD